MFENFSSLKWFSGWEMSTSCYRNWNTKYLFCQTPSLPGNSRWPKFAKQTHPVPYIEVGVMLRSQDCRDSIALTGRAEHSNPGVPWAEGTGSDS
jgi:hypothetical protein